jgi:hypothetical protein
VSSRDRAEDSGFDRLVERELSRGTARPAGHCPQVELLAAWFDKALPPGATGEGADAASIERHLAACGRCQAVVAGLARSEPEILYVHPKPAARPWTWHVRWAAPLAAAALVVLAIGVSLLRPTPQDYAMATTAPAPSAALEAEAHRQPVASSSLEAPSGSPVTTLPAPTVERQAEPSKHKTAELAAKAAPETPGFAPSLKPEASDAAGSLAKLEALPAPPPPPSADTLARSDVRGEPGVGGQRSRPEGKGAAPAEAAAPAPAAPPPSAQAAASFRTTVASARAREQLALSAPASMAPGGSRVGWRPAGPGLVLRTEDAGATWTEQHLPAAARLSVVSAVALDVCWGGGPAGTVLRTVDGRTWHVVAPPAGQDIVAITATSAVQASVRTAGGDTYETMDAGATWHKLH